MSFFEGAATSAPQPEPEPATTVTFTMIYGAAPDEATALDALETAGAELYSLAQPDVPNGATTGEPNTFIWATKPANAATNHRSSQPSPRHPPQPRQQPPPLPGVVRQ